MLPKNPYIYIYIYILRIDIFGLFGFVYFSRNKPLNELFFKYTNHNVVFSTYNVLINL